MDDDIIRIELGDELDLHAFHPRDAKPLLREFLVEARKNGFMKVRIAHGKGKSVIKSIVQSELEKNPIVEKFHDEQGNWGATIAYLSSRTRSVRGRGVTEE